MPDTSDRIDSLEIKVKKLIALHNDLLKENKKLKKDLEELLTPISVVENIGADGKKRRGRPRNDSMDESSRIVFEDSKEMRNLINELILEIDKNIAKLED